MQQEIAALREDLEALGAWRDAHLKGLLSHSDRLLDGAGTGASGDGEQQAGDQEGASGGGGEEGQDVLQLVEGCAESDSAPVRQRRRCQQLQQLPASQGCGSPRPPHLIARDPAMSAAMHACDSVEQGGRRHERAANASKASGERGQEIVPKLDLTPVTSPSISPTTSATLPLHLSHAPSTAAQPPPQPGDHQSHIKTSAPQGRKHLESKRASGEQRPSGAGGGGRDGGARGRGSWGGDADLLWSSDVSVDSLSQKQKAIFHQLEALVQKHHQVVFCTGLDASAYLSQHVASARPRPCQGAPEFSLRRD